MSFFIYPESIEYYDPEMQYRMALYIVTFGFNSWFAWFDPTSWYPIGTNISATFYPGVPFSGAIAYFLLNDLGFNIDLYTVCYFLPAFEGAFACIITYFLGKEILDKKTGLIAAFFLAFTPAFIERTAVGFFDTTALGMFFIVLSLYFFTRSLKRGSIVSAILSGFSLGLLAASWGSYIYLIYIYSLTAILLLLLKKYTSRLFMTYSITITLAVFIITRIPVTGGADALKSFEVLPALIVLVILLFYEIFLRLNTQRTMILETVKRYIPVKGKAQGGIEWFFENRQRFLLLVGGVTVILIGAVAITHLSTFSSITGLATKFITVIYPPYRYSQYIVASVAEQVPTPWGEYFYELNALIILFPAGLYFAFKRRYEEDLLLIVYGATIAYFSGSMIRLLIILAPAAALLSAYALSTIFRPLAQAITKRATTIARRRRMRISVPLGRDSALLVFALIGIILVAGLYMGIQATLYSPAPPQVIRDTYGNGYLDWDQAFSFMRNQLPANAVVAAWWDYGYMINVFGGRTTLADGSTRNFTQIGWIGRAFMETNETYSLQDFQRLGSPQYVLVFFGYSVSNVFNPGIGGDDGKWPVMVNIASNELPELVESLYESGASQSYINNFIANTPYEYEFYNQYALPGTSPILPAFYNTTIYKLLYYHSPFPNIPTSDYDTLNGELYSYMSSESYPLVIGANETPSSAYPYIPSWPAGYENLTYFTPVFISSEGLIKIYQINYAVLNSGLNITSATVSSTTQNGTVTLNNTGTTTYDITQILSNNTDVTSPNATLPLSLAPAQTITISFTMPQIVYAGNITIIQADTSIPDFYAQTTVTVT
jgi:dolichyl-diphosphooligosaccharide--protein glycosyltransferase